MRTSGLMIEVQSISKNELIIMRTSGLMIMKFWSIVELQDAFLSIEILSNFESLSWKFWSFVKFQGRDEFLSIEILSNFESLSWNFEALLSFKEEMNFCRLKYCRILKVCRENFEALLSFKEEMSFCRLKYCRILKICREILKNFEVQSVFKNKAYAMIIVKSCMEDSVGF